MVTDFPIAYDSYDHIEPLGTKKDNTRNSRFIYRCEELFHKHGIRCAKILDICCAGGGCVEDFVLQGHDAWGIEGSDYSQKIGRASWGTIPDRLHTCDASRPFTILREGEVLQFDLIYSFEVMEHIPFERLENYFQNIYKHLMPHGYFIGTFTCRKSHKHPNHHQTVMNEQKWYDYIRKLNLFEFVSLNWGRKDYLRFSKIKRHCIPISMRKI